MKKVNFLSLLLMLALAGCNIPGGPGVTVAPPTPVVITATAAPATAAASTQTSAPAPVSTATVPPLPVVTNTTPPQPTQAGQPAPEAIAILQPGPGSRVVSPLRVSGVADPTFEQSLVITILSADGVEITTASAQIGADVGQRGPYAVDVPFSVSQEQPGFVQVYAVSARDGGVTHLSSVVVTLMPNGTASLNAAAERPEQLQLRQPAPGAEISGGVLHVEGFGLASFEQTLVVELLDENGTVLASVPVIVQAPDMGQPGPFSADLPYTLAAASAPARLQVRDVSPAHGGNTHLTSIEISLRP